MADKENHQIADTDEERGHETQSQTGHASHERGAAHTFNHDDAAEAGRKGAQARAMSQANHETGGDAPSGGEDAPEERPRGVRGGTHDQHVKAGTKGGSRIRQLIEMGYKYEQEHGIGPGQNERSKLAAKKRAKPTSGDAESSS
jgi:hypothetical protein